MSELLHNASAASLNNAAFQVLLRFARDVAGLRPEAWQLVDTGPFLALHGTGSRPEVTLILEARAGASDEDIGSIRQRFGASALIFLTATPDGGSGLHERLTSLGFTRHDTPAMAATMDTLPVDEPPPPVLRVTTVDTDEAHAILTAIQIETLGKDFAPRAAMKRLFGLDQNSPVGHLLGWIGDRPVASATLMCIGEPASLWGIATLPDVRGQGIGRAMTLEACRWARSRGREVVSLYATPMGMPVYSRLGFRSCGTLAMYTAAPTEASSS